MGYSDVMSWMYACDQATESFGQQISLDGTCAGKDTEYTWEAGECDGNTTSYSMQYSVDCSGSGLSAIVAIFAAVAALFH